MSYNNKLMIVVFFSIFNVVLYSQQPAYQYKITVTDSTEGGKLDLFFGLDQNASDSIDLQLGEEELPPIPPVGAFDARLILPKDNYNGSSSSIRDYRNAAFPYSGSKTYSIKYQVGFGNRIYIHWDLPLDCSGRLQDVFGGSLIDIPVNGKSFYTVEEPSVFDQLMLKLDFNNSIAGVENKKEVTPKTIALSNNYPNPFNPETRVSFTVPEKSNITIKIYDILGTELFTVLKMDFEPGDYNLNISLNDYPTGTYLLVLTSGNYHVSKKLLLIK